MGNPYPDYIPTEYEGNCQNDYIQGYRREVLRKKKSANIFGGAIGVGTIVLLVSSSY